MSLAHLPPVGLAVGIWRWGSGQISVRRREAAVSRREVGVQQRESHMDVVERFDTEKRDAQERGIELAVVRPSFATWRSPHSLEFQLEIQIRNTWVYRATLYKLVGSVHVKEFEDVPVPTFEHELELLPLVWQAPQHKVIWDPPQVQLAKIRAPCAGSYARRELIVRATAYLFDSDGKRFSVTRQLEGWLFVDYRPS